MMGIEPMAFRISDGCAKPLSHTCYKLLRYDSWYSLFSLHIWRNLWNTGFCCSDNSCAAHYKIIFELKEKKYGNCEIRTHADVLSNRSLVCPLNRSGKLPLLITVFSICSTSFLINITLYSISFLLFQ